MTVVKPNTPHPNPLPQGERGPEAPDPQPQLKRPPSRRRALATLAVAAVAYFAFAAAATYPVILTFGSELPGQLTDPLEHLWLMRWSRACLVEGRSPFFAEGLNAPIGLPLGAFPTLHVQTLGYLLMGLVTSNDLARFDVLWFAGFVATGLGTFVLGWWAVRRVIPAWLAGLGAMLCGPMLMHAHGHLETMQVGAVPLFLIGWVRFVDAPSRGRLIAATFLYLLMVASAPYFAVLAVFPAAWYVAWAGFAAGRADRRGWWMDRLGWLAGFAGLALAGLAPLFAPQIWAAVHGFPMARTRAEFDRLGAPAWSTFAPSPLHALGRFAAPDLFAKAGYSGRMSECSSYLGVVPLGLLAYAALGRVRFARAGYWWSALGLMVVLSWGSKLELGSTRLGLPAGWIYGIFPPFHLIRVPAPIQPVRRGVRGGPGIGGPGRFAGADRPADAASHRRDRLRGLDPGRPGDGPVRDLGDPADARRLSTSGLPEPGRERGRRPDVRFESGTGFLVALGLLAVDPPRRGPPPAIPACPTSGSRPRSSSPRRSRPIAWPIRAI